jgi:hypothetical protein
MGGASSEDADPVARRWLEVAAARRRSEESARGGWGGCSRLHRREDTGASTTVSRSGTGGSGAGELSQSGQARSRQIRPTNQPDRPRVNCHTLQAALDRSAAERAAREEKRKTTAVSSAKGDGAGSGSVPSCTAASGVPAGHLCSHRVFTPQLPTPASHPNLPPSPQVAALRPQSHPAVGRRVARVLAVAGWRRGGTCLRQTI